MCWPAISTRDVPTQTSGFSDGSDSIRLDFVSEISTRKSSTQVLREATGALRAVISDIRTYGRTKQSVEVDWRHKKDLLEPPTMNNIL